MRVVLRVIAVWFGVAGLVLALLLLHLGGITRVMSARAGSALAFLVVSIGLSLYAAVQLWRLRQSGRLAAIGVCVALAAFTLVQFGSPGLSEVVRLAADALVMVILLSPAAKRAWVEFSK